ncbi:MAG: hypothetical protein JW797_06795 [Bradymonadales bacterium]|nr:hypothetical protein [Bradymonadales bacterium]
MSKGTESSCCICVLLALFAVSCIHGQVGPAPLTMPVTGEPEDAVIPDHTVVVIEGDDGVAVSFITDRKRSFLRGYERSELCESPCIMRIPNGSYAMTAGGSYLMEQFELEAAGGLQTWEVDDTDWGMFIGGFFILEAGLTGIALFGLPQLGAYDIGEGAPGDWPDEIGYVIGALGVAAVIGGIWMLTEWEPEADLVRTEYPEPLIE